MDVHSHCYLSGRLKTKRVTAQGLFLFSLCAEQLGRGFAPMLLFVSSDEM